MSAGMWHTCAIHTNNVTCWGNNYEGQLGLPNITNANSNLSQDQSKDNLMYFIANLDIKNKDMGRIKQITNMFKKYVTISSE